MEFNWLPAARETDVLEPAASGRGVSGESSRRDGENMRRRRRFSSPVDTTAESGDREQATEHRLDRLA